MWINCNHLIQHCPTFFDFLRNTERNLNALDHILYCFFYRTLSWTSFTLYKQVIFRANHRIESQLFGSINTCFGQYETRFCRMDTPALMHLCLMPLFNISQFSCCEIHKTSRNGIIWIAVCMYKCTVFNILSMKTFI